MTTIAVALAAVLVPVAWARGVGNEHALGDALLFGVALAVAAIPEGLLAVVTLALSLGAQRMARGGTIVRHLPAIEALGAASVLCFDKTGTLTTGRLRVAEVVPVDGRDDALWAAVLRCNDAEGRQGDPLDVAVAEEAARRAVPRPIGTRMSEQPFDTATRLMATVHDGDCGPVLSVKGAPEAVLARCTGGGDVEQLTLAVDRLAARGRRVIAVADAPGADLDARCLRALGLVAFEDPLRSTAGPAVAALQEAGVRLVLVTGDHAATAASTAEAVGLDATPLITGEMLSSGSGAAVADAAVLARVDPSVKVDLVAAHRAAGRIVAMTGDGVNDAPALRQADVGVAVLGGAGTDVAREAADVVVTDADLSMIVEAVREGRRIYRNLVSVVGYLLSGNLSEIAVIVAAMVAFPDIATVLLPVQLLWVNLVTDGIPALALAVDIPPDDPLKGPPRSPGVPLLHRRRLLELIGRGAVAAAAVVGVTVISGSTGEGAIRAQLVVALVFCHLVLAYVARHEVAAFARGWWRNRLLLVAVGTSAVLQVAAFVIAPLRQALALDALPPTGWLYAVGAAFATVVIIDGGRLLARLARP
jgi:Ca2+-transporting ATPase